MLPPSAPPSIVPAKPEHTLRPDSIVCVHHPNRLAEAECPRCGRTLCPECAEEQARAVRCCPGCRRRRLGTHEALGKNIWEKGLIGLAWGALILCMGGSAIALCIPSIGLAGMAIGGLLAFSITLGICISLALRTAGRGAITVLRIPKRFFFESQTRLSDLILLVVLLGNGTGLMVQRYGSIDPTFTVAACLFWAFYVLATATWALWVAQHLKVDGVLPRYGLILLGLVAIPSIVAVFPALAGTCRGLNALANGDLLDGCWILALSVFAVLACVFLTGLAGHYHLSAHRQASGRRAGRPYRTDGPRSTPGH